MKTKLTLAIVAALVGGCVFVPVGYDDGYYRHRHGYHRDRDDYYRHDGWRGSWRDDGRYYSSGVYYRAWDHGQRPPRGWCGSPRRYARTGLDSHHGRHGALRPAPVEVV